MLNLLLEMSQIYKGKTFYFFSYEEPVRNIFIKVLNRIIDTDLLHTYPYTFNLKTKTNYEFIKTYIATGRNDLPELEAGKEILRDLVDSQRIRVIGKNYMVEDLYNVINYLNKKEEIGTVFIDYIQRIQCKSKYTNTQERLAYISDYVLQISKDSGLPIILGAQLNRATLEAKDKRPSLENLKASGNLEEDANTVISVYCPIKEEEDKEDWDLSDKHNSRSVNLEIKTLKNREGEVNKTSKLGWDRWTGRIKDENII
jgi:replicative DNA helicase